ncbi:hypothetical protein FQZ97_1241240 [compost metagenome]
MEYLAQNQAAGFHFAQRLRQHLLGHPGQRPFQLPGAHGAMAEREQDHRCPFAVQDVVDATLRAVFPQDDFRFACFRGVHGAPQ